ncbi:branched-chain alpha-keto acid dehydrogenase E2 component [Lophium mytilinum]|uniref:Dihydrolipoamide acetyltransferase component of pyruvate dehydrogenase complex n=1 Tax=Lophium mytilinum TaxID=390894 RepID=A0A6A6QUF2_9PEZI|nr:branched-chain alpha-keto acid dehydrogenase E2 component [Lophium mytilinum]
MKHIVAKEVGSLLSRCTAPTRVSYASRHFKSSAIPRQQPRRQFHSTPALDVVKPYLLADIGEGITECQVIQWFVQPGARVEQFDPICEVQSDKASVEITSRFDGVIKKLYYEQDDMAKVGKPLVDIDIQSDISPEDEALLNDNDSKVPPLRPTPTGGEEAGLEVDRLDTKGAAGDAPPPPPPQTLPPKPETTSTPSEPKAPRTLGKHASLATPAVRHLTKELNIQIEDIEGTGKEGRVTKEDVQKYAAAQKETPTTTKSSTPAAPEPQAEDQVRPLTPIQKGMFKQMTRSLSIPHFLYTDNVDFTSLSSLRKRLNASKEKSQKLSALPFVVKAVSLALSKHPLLNSHLDTSNAEKPQMVVKAQHNIGIAIDSPSGLLVPVVKNVQSLSIEAISAEIGRLGALARSGKLTNADLSGASFTLSNIGSIGGTAVAPVIVSPQVAILGVGRARVVPAFGKDGELVKKEEAVFSWSADHRVVDGAAAARCAEDVRSYLENVESMLVQMK